MKFKRSNHVKARKQGINKCKSDTSLECILQVGSVPEYSFASSSELCFYGMAAQVLSHKCLWYWFSLILLDLLSLFASIISCFKTLALTPWTVRAHAWATSQVDRSVGDWAFQWQSDRLLGGFYPSQKRSLFVIWSIDHNFTLVYTCIYCIQLNCCWFYSHLSQSSLVVENRENHHLLDWLEYPLGS